MSWSVGTCLLNRDCRSRMRDIRGLQLGDDGLDCGSVLVREVVATTLFSRVRNKPSVVVGFNFSNAAKAARYAFTVGPFSSSAAASAAHAARTVRHNGSNGSFVAFPAVARRGVDVVRLPLAMIRSFHECPGLVRAGWELALPLGSPFLYNRKMAKATAVIQKKKHLGRPRTGVTPLVAFRPPQELINAIDAWAAAAKVSRSEAMRQLIEAGLKRRPKV